MPFAEALPGWEGAYQTWLQSARPLLEAALWKEAFAGYPWVQPAETPFVPVSKPLSEMKLGVVSTAGFYLTGAQPPFTAWDVEGDPTFRELPTEISPGALSIAHTHYPHDAALADWNAVLPLDHMRAMVSAGELGSLGPVFSISGYCTNAVRLLRESAENIAVRAREEGCDAMLLVPV
jgi:D-proline reductase (dithiol) PrdB